MIDINKPKVKEIIEQMHEAMQRKSRRGGHSKDEIVIENRIFSIICSDYDMIPKECAAEMNSKYGYSMTGDDIIQIFRNRRIANPVERKEILQWAEKISEYFAEAVDGDRDNFDSFEKLRKESALKNGKKHDVQERVAAIMIFSKHPEIDVYDDFASLEMLGNTLAKYFFYDLSDVISNVYGFPQFRAEKKGNHSKDEKELSYEEALKKINKLENILSRTNTMFQDLQDEFAQQLEECKLKELTDFFAKLNSEKYGCILDELLMVRKGVDELRKNSYEIPMEISGLLLTIKRLIQFVRDCHIEPIMKLNTVLEVTVSDVETCDYDGTPFITVDDVKKVRVLSSGWVYKDKDIQISKPKVKEEK